MINGEQRNHNNSLSSDDENFNVSDSSKISLHNKLLSVSMKNHHYLQSVMQFWDIMIDILIVVLDWCNGYFFTLRGLDFIQFPPIKKY